MKALSAALATLCAIGVVSISSAQTTTLRLAHSLSANEPAHTAAVNFAKRVTDKSGGKIVVQVFPGEQLGTGKEMNEMVRQGATVINLTDAGYLSDFVPDVGVLVGPYLINDPKDYNKILASDWYKGVDLRLQKAGMRVISMNGFFGTRYVLADKPIRKPADIQGMTVRVPPNTMWIETVKAMGARPTVVQWSEIYNALQQNVVQACEAPLASMWGSKLHETRKVISLTGHFSQFLSVVMNNDVFNRLPKELQTLLLNEGQQYGAELTRLTLASQQDYMAKFKAAGVTIVEDVDRAAFRQMTASVYKAFPKWTAGTYESVAAALKQ
jgi:TRAP-type transport system periplasmic protein